MAIFGRSPFGIKLFGVPLMFWKLPFTVRVVSSAWSAQDSSPLWLVENVSGETYARED